MRLRLRPISLALVLGIAAVPIGVENAGTESRRVLLDAPWGTSPGAFAMEDHGARPGPSALVVAHERLYVLDRVAGRVQVFGLDGALQETLPIGSRTVDMLAVDGAGAVLVLDAFVRREVRVLRAGQTPEIVRLPTNGRALPSGVFPDRDCFHLEWQHGASSAVACPGLVPPWPTDTPKVASLPGRPTPLGWMRASRSADGAVLETGRRGAPRPLRVVIPDPAGVQEIVSLETDESGRIVVAWVSATDPERRLQVARVDDRGEVIARLVIPDGSITDLYQRLAVAPDGRLFQLRTHEAGVQILEWNWSEAKGDEGGQR